MQLAGRNHYAEDIEVRYLFFRASVNRFLALLLLATLVGCSDNVPTTTTPPGTVPPPVPGTLALGTSANSIPTDNSTSATLTATLVDSSNAVMQGVTISFATTSGNLSASTVTTDASGQASVQLKSGLADLSNRTATITASVGAVSASIPVLITGSTIDLALTPANTIQVGAGTITATATVMNAAGIGISNQTIRFSVSGTGAATLSAASLTTDATGVTPALTFTPTAAGTVVLTADWLDATGAVTKTATQNIIITAAAGIAFAITTPATDPLALTSGATQSLVASVPATIAGVAVSSVRISATSGTWVGTNPVTTGTSILQTPFSGAVAATYTAPVNAGSFTIQVDALDATGTILGILTRTFVVSAPSAAAAQIFLSPSVSTVTPSSGGNISTSTLEVTVRDANFNAVGGAAVMFGLLGTTGSGESVSPAVVITDSSGKASTTFSAGSSPTLAAIYAQARIVGQTCTFVPDGAAESNPLCDEAPLMVSSSAVSVTVGFGTTVQDAANATQYQLPGSVLVVNSNGSPVAGATVTLTVFPYAYNNGTIYRGQDLAAGGSTSAWQCVGPETFEGSGVDAPFFAAEDVNRNGIMDPGEDVNGNGLLSPPQAAGGAVPLTVTTDSNGAATFFLQYPKSSAWFIGDEVTARVIVMGTESAAKMTLILPMSVTDKFSPNCELARTATY
jgi:hypothetical protein